MEISADDVRLNYILTTFTPTTSVFCLLIDPGEERWLVINNFLLLEPQTDLLLGRLDRVGPMADIATDINGIITTNGTGSGLQRVGGSKNDTTLLDNVLAFPNSGQNRAGLHVFQQTREERLLLKIGIMFTEQLFRGIGEFNGNQFVTTLFESTQNRGHKSSVDSVGLCKHMFNI